MSTATQPIAAKSACSHHPAAKAPHAAVVGLQWGDEGKGKVVNILTDEYDYIVRYNGGANAGHTVVVDGQRYALHLIPSGILDESKVNVIGNGVVVHPVSLLQEMDALTARGVKIGPNLRLSSRAHLVMPYHKQQDQLMEAAVSASRGDTKKIGTTGRGIGPAYADKAIRSTALRFVDLHDRDRFADKLRHTVRVKNAMNQALAQLSNSPFEPLDPDQLLVEFAGYADRLMPHICDTTQLLHDAMRSGKKLLFEGANACMLDVDHGTYPYVTSSNCSSLGVYAGSGVPGGRLGRVIGIMKAYTTRVGGGPFPTEQDNEEGHRIRERGREYGTTTGRPRRCGWLDLMVLKYSAMVCGATEISVMLLDVLAGFRTIRLCTAYELDGRHLDAFPADAETLRRVKPVYQEVEGFDQEIGQCRDFDELPPAARRYIQLIEQHVGVPVRLVSIGPDRKQTLLRGIG